MRIRLLLVIGLWLVSGHSTGSAAPETPRSGQLCFGWAKKSITPDRPVAIAGQYSTRIGGEVHDPLLATALAVETRDEFGVIDQAVTTNPFELYTDYGVRIKARSPAVQTLVIQITSGCAAYLPTRRAVAGGGYSARIVDGVVGPEGGNVLVNETVKTLHEMWRGD